MEETPNKKDPRWLREEIRKVVADSQRRVARLFDESSAEPSSSSPWVNGWFVRVGSDGVPKFTKVGDSHPGPGPVPRRPYWVAYFDRKARRFEVRVLLPGAQRRHVQVEATPHSVRIHAAGLGAQYDLEVPSPVEIDPQTCEAHFSKGILTARLPTIGTAANRKPGRIHYGAADSGA